MRQSNKETVMMKEERYIGSRMGGGNPFRVPDGYFEDFASQIMDKLPEREVCADGDARVVSMNRRRRPVLRHILYAAACLCVAVFGVTAYLSKVAPAEERTQGGDVVASHYHKAADTDSYEDDFADYAMLDNADIYAYLSGE